MGSKQRHPSRPRTSVAAVVAATVLLLAAGAVLAACGSSTSGGAPAASPAATPAAVAPSATPVDVAQSVPSATNASRVAVKEFHGMLPVVLTQSFIKERAPGTAKTVGDVVQSRHTVWIYRNKSSDPRLNGRLEVVLNVDQRQGDMSAMLWGTSRLTNSGGTWVGRWTGGIGAGGNVHHLYMTEKGTGGYAGLVSHSSGWFVEAGQGFTPDIQIVNAGWIETTDGSPVPPAPGPGTTPANWTPVVVVETINHPAYAGPEPWLVDVEASDGRVGGRLQGSFEGDAERADGSVDYGGGWSITNLDGAWKTSAFSGVRGPGAVEHFQYATFSGSGAYAGLTYHEFSHFMERQDYAKGDMIISSGWIEEAK